MAALCSSSACALAFLSRWPVILASPIVCNPHCNLGSLSPASCNGLLMGNLTTTQPSQRVFLELCKPPWSPNFYIFHACKTSTTWMILSSIACLNCSLIPLYHCCSGLHVPLRLMGEGGQHMSIRQPFWISKLLWCSQFRFSLLNEFHKLGFGMEWMDGVLLSDVENKIYRSQG